MTPKKLLPLLLLVAMPAWSQSAGETPQIAVDPATTEVSGLWAYTTTAPSVTGKCPPGPAMAGTLVINAQGNAAALVMQSGAVCNPAVMCLYSGTIEGPDMLFYTNAVVDDEGGQASTTMRLSFADAAHGGGEVSSAYLHPKGFECRWNFDITLSRPD